MQALFAPHLVEPVIVTTRERCIGPDWVTADIVAGDKLHEHILAVSERSLVVSQEFPGVFRLLLGHKRVVHLAGKFVIRRLPEGRNETGMLWVLAPLRPALCEYRGAHQGDPQYRGNVVLDVRIHVIPPLS